MKDFLKTIAGKICIGAVALVVTAGLAVGGFFLWRYCLPKFQDITLELGTASITADMFLSEHGDADKAAFVTPAEQIAYDRVGTTEITLVQDGKEETVLLTVQDTTAPKVTFRDHSVRLDGSVKAEDFIEEAFDYSELTYELTGQVVPNENYDNTAVTITVTDACGNKVSQDCTLSFQWTYGNVVIELGTALTKEALLLYPEKDGDTINQAHIDLINTVGAGEYQIPAIKNGLKQLCTIIIQDTIAPELVVKDLNIFKGTAFTADSFVESVTDLSKIASITFAEEPSVEAGSYTVTIVATDAQGNTTSKEAKLEIVADSDGPVFSGGDTIYIGKNGKPNYTSGISATDNVDGKVNFTYDASNVNLSAAGVYYVTYKAVDKAGNETTFRRKVEIAHDQSDIDALIAKMAEKCGDTPLEISQFVRNYIKYNSNWGGNSPVWYGFTNKVGNCFVHMACLEALLQYKGYTTQRIYVNEIGDNGRPTHYWLIVDMGGYWRHIDPTPGVKHPARLMTDEDRYANLQGRDWDREKWPACE